jgi:hypothetical protein
MKRKLWVMIIAGIFWMLFSSTIAYASDQGAVDLSINESQAVFTALSRFRAEGYKESGYRISIQTNAEGFEIVFVPPLKKSGNWIGVEPSGLPEVHYYMNSSGSVVLKKLLGQ